jgi:competence protein ComEC
MLVWIAAALSAGIALGDALGVRPFAALLVGLAAGGVLVAARLAERWVGVASLGVAFALGLGGQAARPRAPPALVDGLPWTVEGEVARAPERSFGRSRVVIELVAVERGERRREASGRVAVTLAGDPIEPLLPGDRVRFLAPLRVPRGFANPGAPDLARRAAADGVVAVAGLHDPAALARLAVDVPPGLRRSVAAWRARMAGAIDERLQGVQQALVESLVVGDRGAIDHALDDAFRAAGVSHVLSVSGLHLAVAAFLFYVGLTRLLVRVPRWARGRPVRRWAAAAGLPAVVIYTLLTGAEVATVRACVVALVYFGAVALDRRTTSVGALAVAALAVLLISPLELFDPSFQLSFAAALGTGLLGARWSPKGSGGSFAFRALRWALRLCAASAAAIVATLPIGAFWFSQVSPMGILSNLVVVPLAELGVVPVGLAGAVLSVTPGLGWLGGALLHVAGWGAAAMAGFVRWFAAWAPSWHVAAPSFVEIVAWYAGLLALASGTQRGRRLAAVCALVVAASLGAHALATRLSTTATATFLDVGQGDACVIELPHGRVAVVDGGGSFDPEFDPGREVLAPFLWRRGIFHIDLVVLSHPHPDHANGLPFLVENFTVGEIWTNGQESHLPALQRLLQAAATRGVRLGEPRPLELGGAQLRPLAPFDDDGRLATDPTLGENDNSLVVELSWGGRRLLLTGDVEREAEARLAPRLPGEDVVKVPHHGSRTSSTEPLVQATRPSLAVISVGERNRWGFPHPSVLARWRAAGARILRTDLDGAVTISASRRGTLSVDTVLH